jgi:hypothetical protein
MLKENVVQTFLNKMIFQNKKNTVLTLNIFITYTKPNLIHSFIWCNLFKLMQKEERSDGNQADQSWCIFFTFDIYLIYCQVFSLDSRSFSLWTNWNRWFTTWTLDWDFPMDFPMVLHFRIPMLHLLCLATDVKFFWLTEQYKKKIGHYE